MAFYVAEALRGQLAQAASAKAAGAGGAPTPSHSELLKTLKQLVDEAMAERAEQGATGPPPAEAGPLHVSFSAARDLPGAPCLPATRQVRGLKGGHEVGEIHDAVVSDPGIPAAAWVTRCRWRFGTVPHRFFDAAETTCARCLSRRAVEARMVLGA